VVTTTTNLVGNNSYHVVVGSGVNNIAVLDGFSVTGGNANGTSPNNLGSGLYNSSGSPTLSNVTFSGNSAYLGGGVYNASGSSPLLSNVTFSSNSAAFGGGLYNTSSTPTLTNVVFSGNSAFTTGSGYGGGMYNYQSSSTLTNVTFSGNSAYGGGGMSNQSSSNSILTNVTFSGNSATGSGGGMYIVSSSPVLTNVTFISNSATSGGGLFNESNSNPLLTNVTFSGNSVSVDGGGMYNWNSSPTLANITFSGNSAYDGGGMTNYVQGNPTLTNVTFSGNSVGYKGGGIYNYQSSPTLTNITLSSNSAYIGGGLYSEQGSNLVIRNTLLWGNTASYYAQAFNYSSNSTLIISDSVIQDGCPAGGTCNTIITADPRLSALGDYGGSVQTLKLGTDSAAIDAANATYCPATDQRGQPRDDLQCDIGAYEVKYSDSDTVIRSVDSTIGTTFGPALIGVQRDSGQTDPGVITATKSLTWKTNPANAIDAYWYITPTVTSGFNLTLTLCYTPTESNGHNLNALRFWRYSANQWHAVVGTPMTSTVGINQCATLNGITELSVWTLATDSPTAVTLNALSARTAVDAVRSLTSEGRLLLMGLVVGGAWLNRRRTRRG
jgi:predicted outer membrane repeat protein